MSCEQELNSDSATCVYIPAIQSLSADGLCPDGFRRFDDKTIIRNAPVCLEENIPPGYKCTTPLHCMRSRILSTLIVEKYKALRDAY